MTDDKQHLKHLDGCIGAETPFRQSWQGLDPEMLAKLRKQRLHAGGELDNKSPPKHSAGATGAKERHSRGRLDVKTPTRQSGGGMDAKTAAMLRELEAQKAAAVREEDYDEAKRLKQAIDGLKQLAAQLAELESRHALRLSNETAIRSSDLMLCCGWQQLCGEHCRARPSSWSWSEAAGSPAGQILKPGRSLFWPSHVAS